MCFRVVARMHARAHTHDENREKKQSKKSGERKLLRSCRAALDIFRSVDRSGNVQLWKMVAILPLRPDLHPHQFRQVWA